MLKPRSWSKRFRKFTRIKTAFKLHFFDVIQRDHTHHFKDSELTNQQGWTKSNTNTPAYEAAVGGGGIKVLLGW